MRNSTLINNKRSFTLLEILVVFTIFTMLSVVIIFVIKPISIVNRAIDIGRKRDLDDAKKILEQYLSDTGCYPQPTQICMEGTNTSPCHICTKAQHPFFSYFTRELCDPRHGTSDYLYQTDTYLIPKVGYFTSSCPKWFHIFTVLDSVSINDDSYDPAQDIWGCKKGGCGVNPLYGYDYLVTSPGGPSDSVATSNWYCYLSQYGRCVQCTPYENCVSSGNDCYGKMLYPMRQTCCTANRLSSCN